MLQYIGCYIPWKGSNWQRNLLQYYWINRYYPIEDEL